MIISKAGAASTTDQPGKTKRGRGCRHTTLRKMRAVLDFNDHVLLLNLFISHNFNRAWSMGDHRLRNASEQPTCNARVPMRSDDN